MCILSSYENCDTNNSYVFKAVKISLVRPSLLRPMVVRPLVLKSAFLQSKSVSPIGLRFLATKAPESKKAAKVDAKTKATSLIDMIPGSNFVTKTGTLATAAAATVYSIAEGFFVINGESLLVITFFSFIYMTVKVIAPLYGEFARKRIGFVTKTLNDARENHVNAVKDRISEVSNLKDVVTTTKALFEMSKETAAIEAEAFELKQKVEVANKAKSVLDSWVRYEAQVRQLQQEQLSSTVIGNVKQQLKDSKFEDKVLAESVSEVERLFAKEK